MEKKVSKEPLSLDVRLSFFIVFTTALVSSAISFWVGVLSESVMLAIMIPSMIGLIVLAIVSILSEKQL